MNQMELEKEIQAREKANKKTNEKPQPNSDQNLAEITELEPLDQAAKRFLEGMQGNAMETPGYDSIWSLAADSGIPFAVAPGVWYNFRQYWFTKKRKKEKLGQFGLD